MLSALPLETALPPIQTIFPQKRVIFFMTKRQAEYVKHRAAGLGQARAAIKAGYAAGSAKVIASRMERMPEIAKAIEDARKSAHPDEQEFDSPQAYLMAVVLGKAPADPVRVGAARALLPYLEQRKRAPMKSATPGQLSKKEERGQHAEWEATAAEIRRRMKRKD